MAYTIFDGAGALQLGTNNSAAALVAACRLAAGGCVVESDTWEGGYVRVAHGLAARCEFAAVTPWDAAMLAARIAFATA